MKMTDSPAQESLPGGMTRLAAGLRVWGWLLLVAAVLGVASIARWVRLPLGEGLQTFVTIFLGIFIEAVPFLLAGSLVSGLIAVFVDSVTLARFVPRRAVPAVIAGTMLGFIFPVCECGVVPVTRRLYAKGLPIAVGVTFLLAAPVINPVVLLSTYAAFGFGPILIGRLVLSLLIAGTVGLIFTLVRPQEVLLPQTLQMAGRDSHRHVHSQSVPGRVVASLQFAGEDFFDMTRYLIVGSLMAAAMQTIVPQSALLAVGSGPVISVLVTIALAFVLSICSTVDAFIALSFASTFTTGSVLAFLVFGPMVDIKSSFMFLGVFKPRTVLYLILLPLALALLAGVAINLNLPI